MVLISCTADPSFKTIFQGIYDGVNGQVDEWTDGRTDRWTHNIMCPDDKVLYLKNPNRNLIQCYSWGVDTKSLKKYPKRQNSINVNVGLLFFLYSHCPIGLCICINFSWWLLNIMKDMEGTRPVYRYIISSKTRVFLLLFRCFCTYCLILLYKDR